MSTVTYCDHCGTRTDRPYFLRVEWLEGREDVSRIYDVQRGRNPTLCEGCGPIVARALATLFPTLAAKPNAPERIDRA